MEFEATFIKVLKFKKIIKAKDYDVAEEKAQKMLIKQCDDPDAKMDAYG